MKTNYFFKTILALVFTIALNSNMNAQIRILNVDPAGDTVTIKNFGGATVNIASYRLCSLFSYKTLSTQTTVVDGSLNLGPDAEVTIFAENYLSLSTTAADLGLYFPTGNFGTASSMVDFMQWGAGGQGRENVAVAKGIWTAGTFVNVAPPYSFTGSAVDTGVTFWDTLLSVDDIETTSSFTVYPNPTNALLNIEITSSEAGLTYQVFDILGKQIISKNLESERLSQIDVSNWNSGLYLIKISNGDKTETKRFIKQ
ncbi:T9SS type A sorting domain-containing protein [uncultured Psychroserpens sp.]|uniref:T9SS type A sorting domain-containing protein n=1 Tax=uncultured Psychroserpens sp. TaxID=255436 RepID=UPI0026157A2D|nr:T9SS type A sorting domain-containing protein [uncultured Psychroserpens sp.]